MSLGKEETETQTQTTEPWKVAQPALKDILGQSGSLFTKGQSLIGANPSAPFFNKATDALGSLFSGSGPLSALSDTARGDFLDVTNSPMWGSLTGGVQDAVNSQFSAAGRTGSPAHAGVMTSELGKLAGQLWGQERSNQLNASNQLGSFLQSGVGMSPGIHQLGNADLDALWQNLSRYGSVAQGIGGMGGQGESTITRPDNTLGDILGGLSSIVGMGGGLGSLFGGGGGVGYGSPTDLGNPWVHGGF